MDRSVIHTRAGGRRATYELTRSASVARPLPEVFEFFADAQNLGVITPPWLSFKIVDAPETMCEGALIEYRLRLHGVSVGWTSEITDWQPPHSFTDVQRRGPYASWEHTHRFSSQGPDTEIFDHVLYRPPGGPLGPLVRAAFVRRQLDELFDYRSAKIAEIFSAG